MQFNYYVNKFLGEIKSQISETTYLGYKAYLNVFCRIIHNKDNVNTEDIVIFLNSKEFTKLKVSSQNKVKMQLQKFFKWYGLDTGKLLRPRRAIKKQLNKADLLTKEEFKTLINELDDPLSKAFFSLLMESAARKSEILNMKMKDITFYDSYANIYIGTSKTAQRNVPIIESIPFIARYLEIHPFRNDPDAWLFGHYVNGEFGKFSVNYCNQILKRKIKNLGNKRLYPHLFRHTSMSNYAKHLTEFQLKKFGGLVMDSKMVARYVHLSSVDIESKMLELHGLKLPVPEKVTNLELIKCPRCDYTNSELDKYCSRCGSALNLNVVLEQKELANFAIDKYSLSEIREYVKNLENKLDEVKKKLSE